MHKNLQKCNFFYTFVSVCACYALNARVRTPTENTFNQPANNLNIKYNESIRINRQDLR